MRVSIFALALAMGMVSVAAHAQTTFDLRMWKRNDSEIWVEGLLDQNGIETNEHRLLVEYNLAGTSAYQTVGSDTDDSNVASLYVNDYDADDYEDDTHIAVTVEKIETTPYVIIQPWDRSTLMLEGYDDKVEETDYSVSYSGTSTDDIDVDFKWGFTAVSGVNRLNASVDLQYYDSSTGWEDASVGYSTGELNDCEGWKHYTFEDIPKGVWTVGGMPMDMHRLRLQIKQYDGTTTHVLDTSDEFLLDEGS